MRMRRKPQLIMLVQYSSIEEIIRRSGRSIEPVENRPKKRQRPKSFCIDLTDVPTQTPIPKSAGYIKQGASKYTG
eukprot:scaffold9622_cov219-Skeletonema_marinoi.AAC.2